MQTKHEYNFQLYTKLFSILGAKYGFQTLRVPVLNILCRSFCSRHTYILISYPEKQPLKFPQLI